MRKKEESRRSQAASAGTGLVRASQPGNLPRLTRTRTPSPPLTGTGLPLATWTPGRPRVQGRAALLQTADRPEGDDLDALHSEYHREAREGETEKPAPNKRPSDGHGGPAERAPSHLACPVVERSQTPANRGRRKDNSRERRIGNDPSAGSPTETLLRLLLPLNATVWSSSRQPGRVIRQAHSPRTSLKRSIGSSDGRCVQRAGT